MKPRSTVSTKIACALLLAVFAWNVYEAVRTPVTPEEAYQFVHFIRPKLRDVVQQYDARDQILQTLLVKRSVGLFRLSQFSLRLPALISVAFYLWAVYRITRKSLVLVALAVLNPFVLGHLWAAGGDAVALALLAWGLERLLRGELNTAGFLLGLSVAASIGAVLPVTLLIVGWLVKSQERWAVVERVGLIALATAFILIAVPLSRWDSGPIMARLKLSTSAPTDSCPSASNASGDCSDYFSARIRRPRPNGSGSPTPNP